MLGGGGGMTDRGGGEIDVDICGGGGILDGGGGIVVEGGGDGRADGIICSSSVKEED